MPANRETDVVYVAQAAGEEWWGRYIRVYKRTTMVLNTEDSPSSSLWTSCLTSAVTIGKDSGLGVVFPTVRGLGTSEIRGGGGKRVGIPDRSVLFATVNTGLLFVSPAFPKTGTQYALPLRTEWPGGTQERGLPAM